MGVSSCVWSKLAFLNNLGTLIAAYRNWDLIGLASCGFARLRFLRQRTRPHFTPQNASGTFAYQNGTWSLRDNFVGEIWRVERPDGVEAIRNDATKVRVAFANVDVAHDDDRVPQPRSRKGGGTERVCLPNMFGSLPHYAPRRDDEWSVYYLMVDENGAAELTRPIVERGTFVACIERIYLSNGTDLDRVAPSLDEGDIADRFDPQVARK